MRAGGAGASARRAASALAPSPTSSEYLPSGRPDGTTTRSLQRTFSPRQARASICRSRASPGATRVRLGRTKVSVATRGSACIRTSMSMALTASGASSFWVTKASTAKTNATASWGAPAPSKLCSIASAARSGGPANSTRRPRSTLRTPPVPEATSHAPRQPIAASAGTKLRHVGELKIEAALDRPEHPDHERHGMRRCADPADRAVGVVAFEAPHRRSRVGKLERGQRARHDGDDLRGRQRHADLADPDRGVTEGEELLPDPVGDRTGRGEAQVAIHEERRDRGPGAEIGLDAGALSAAERRQRERRGGQEPRQPGARPLREPGGAPEQRRTSFVGDRAREAFELLVEPPGRNLPRGDVR